MDFKDGLISGKKEIVIKHQDKDVIFTANEVSYFTFQQLAIDADKENKVFIAALVAESITAPDGTKFTYDEVMKLKRAVARPFIAAVAEVNNVGEQSKN